MLTRTTVRTTWRLGGVVAIGIGLGVARAASMGAAGYVVGLGAALLAFWALPGLRGKIDLDR
jgi:hypothetical protein